MHDASPYLTVGPSKVCAERGSTHLVTKVHSLAKRVYVVGLLARGYLLVLLPAACEAPLMPAKSGSTALTKGLPQPTLRP